MAEKTKRLKTRAGAKGIIFFLIILLVLGGVVYAVFFLPPNAEKIKTSLNENYIAVKSDSDFNTNFNDFKSYSNTNYLSKNEGANRQIKGIELIVNSLQIYDQYMAEVLQTIQLKNYEKSEINTITNNFNSANKKIAEISNYLKDKNTNLTFVENEITFYHYTEAELVLNSVEIKFQQTYQYYEEATTALAKLYRNNVLKGLYSNEFANRAVEGVSYYLTYFHDNFEKFENIEYYNMTINFNKFVKNYLSKENGQPKVAKYYLSEYQTLQTNLKKLGEFESAVDGFKMAELLKNNFVYDDANLTVEQKTCVDFAKSFLKGDIA